MDTIVNIFGEHIVGNRCHVLHSLLLMGRHRRMLGNFHR